MPKNKYSKSFEIALCGISCAVAVLFLSLGIFSGWLIGTGYCMGVIALMLPLTKQFYKGGFLAYLGTCLLALIMGVAANFWRLVPFIMFFGLHPLLNSLQLKFKVNSILAFAIKAVWFCCTLLAAYFLIFDGVMGGSLLPQEFYDFINNNNIYWLVFAVGAPVFAVYDYIIFKCQKAVNYLVYRIKK